MPTSLRRARLAVATCALSLAACSTSEPPPQRCDADDRCPAQSRCLSGACIDNAPPVPDLRLPPGELETSQILVFDGSGSRDPDSDVGDAIVAHSWSFHAIAAPCAPPAVAGSVPLARVRFACAGTFSVELSVTDTKGASAATARSLEVAAHSGPALVTAGPDLALEHTCTPGGRCAPDGPVLLSADGPATATAGVSLLWTVEPPPDRPLGPHRRVAFWPSATAAAPEVTLETLRGEAISGDWLFRVEARDEAGVLASAATRVSVKNRPPVIVKTIPVVHHRFDGVRFTAGGDIPLSIVDPDGDPLLRRSVEARRAGDGDGTFAAVDVWDRVTFSIAVPYRTAADALHLIGGEGLVRAIVVSATDANGADVVETWPIVVVNRGPTYTRPPPATVDHWFSSDAGAYEAYAPLLSWSDPDGDPLVQVPGNGTGDPECPSIEVIDGTSWVRCTRPYTGVPDAASFARSRTVTDRVQDPWEGYAGGLDAHFTIANRPPVVRQDWLFMVTTACTPTGTCCSWDGAGACTRYAPTWAAGAVSASGWSDPDGDPLEIRVGAAEPQVRLPPWALEVGFPETAGCLSTESLTVAASDGAATASQSILLLRKCE